MILFSAMAIALAARSNVVALESDDYKVPDEVLIRAEDPAAFPQIRREGFVLYVGKDGVVVMSGEMFHLADIKDRTALMGLFLSMGNEGSSVVPSDKLGPETGSAVNRIINRFRKEAGFSALPKGLKPAIFCNVSVSLKVSGSPDALPIKIRNQVPVPDDFFNTAFPVKADPVPPVVRTPYDFGFRGAGALTIGQRLRLEGAALDAVAQELDNSVNQYLEAEKAALKKWSKEGDLPASGSVLKDLRPISIKDLTQTLKFEGKSDSEIKDYLASTKVEASAVRFRLGYGLTVDGRRQMFDYEIYSRKFDH